MSKFHLLITGIMLASCKIPAKDNSVQPITVIKPITVLSIDDTQNSKDKIQLSCGLPLTSDGYLLATIHGIGNAAEIIVSEDGKLLNLVSFVSEVEDRATNERPLFLKLKDYKNGTAIITSINDILFAKGRLVTSFPGYDLALYHFDLSFDEHFLDNFSVSSGSELPTSSRRCFIGWNPAIHEEPFAQITIHDGTILDSNKLGWVFNVRLTSIRNIGKGDSGSVIYSGNKVIGFLTHGLNRSSTKYTLRISGINRNSLNTYINHDRFTASGQKSR